MVTMVVTGDGRAEPAKVDAPVKKVAKAAAGAGETDAATRDAVRAVLRAQVDAWNRGDINAFMDHYWKSDNLTFSSRGKTTRGWQATLDSYRKRYPTREKMGRLKLDGLEITPLGDTSAMVLGGWKVDRANEPVGGNFTLVLRKIDGRWVIVHDHTSRLEE
jgi:beta-aspartyl-peptidase (threonine type)